MNKDKPLVSVIIPTRNRTEILNKCLDSLYAQDYPNFEVIMIDASTNHDTEKIIKEQYPQVKYIPFLHKANMRPQSKNLGIEAAKGEILAFIDDDSFVQEGWMSECVKSYDSEDVGGVGGFIIDENAANSEALSFSTIGEVTYNGTRVGNYHRDPGQTIEVDHLRGCNMSLRKDCVVAVNGFDPNYTGSNVVEETDLCIKIKQKGFKILFNPKMKVIHTTAARDTVVRNTFDYRRQYYIARNSVYFMLMNYGVVRTMAYIFTNNTGINAFLKKPELVRFNCIWVSAYGKLAGLCVTIPKWIKKKISNNAK